MHRLKIWFGASEWYTFTRSFWGVCLIIKAGCTISVLGEGPAEAGVQGPGQVGEAAPGAAVTLQNLHRVPHSVGVWPVLEKITTLCQGEGAGWGTASAHDDNLILRFEAFWVAAVLCTAGHPQKKKNITSSFATQFNYLNHRKCLNHGTLHKCLLHLKQEHCQWKYNVLHSSAKWEQSRRRMTNTMKH